jgi:hypothetical protein
MNEKEVSENLKKSSVSMLQLALVRTQELLYNRRLRCFRSLVATNLTNLSVIAILLKLITRGVNV